MYDTSLLYRQIIAGEHWFETKVEIAGNVVDQTQLLSVSADYRMFTESQPTVGGCLSGELSVKLLNPAFAIPRMALVEPYVRVTDGTQYSEWIPQGVFFIDTRETTNNDDDLPILSLHCYDAMLKTEADFPSVSHGWPNYKKRVTLDIANAIGCGLDQRTSDFFDSQPSYPIYLPVGYSMREVLSRIGAMYAGNWVMNYDGDLLLIPINNIPDETRYLVDHSGDQITFGGDRILV